MNIVSKKIQEYYDTKSEIFLNFYQQYRKQFTITNNSDSELLLTNRLTGEYEGYISIKDNVDSVEIIFFNPAAYYRFTKWEVQRLKNDAEEVFNKPAFIKIIRFGGTVITPD